VVPQLPVARAPDRAKMGMVIVETPKGETAFKGRAEAGIGKGPGQRGGRRRRKRGDRGHFRDKLIVDFRRLQFGTLPNRSRPFCGALNFSRVHFSSPARCGSQKEDIHLPWRPPALRRFPPTVEPTSVNRLSLSCFPSVVPPPTRPGSAGTGSLPKIL